MHFVLVLKAMLVQWRSFELLRHVGY